jgi:predicted kinase
MAGSPGAVADCSGHGICVTSLNMRKWMRDRLQRRRKKPTDEAGQPAAPPPPLQPAYFDEAQPAAESDQPAAEVVEIASPVRATVDEGPVREESAAAESSDEPALTLAAGSAARGRTRRRRGGRGRGGRGREQAVAQAFGPAAAKGIVPEVPAGEVEEAPGAEPEAGAEPQAPRVPAGVPAATHRPPKGVVVLAIGLPGSGKSSWFKRHNVVPLSTDMVRSLLFDDIREQRFQDLVFSNLRSMLKARLIAKRPMNYVDATNLTPQERQHWVKLAKDYNYEVHAVFFDVPLEICVERHQRRDRVVPEDIMRRMAAKLKPPAFDEGFAKITVVRVKKKDQEPAEQ